MTADLLYTETERDLAGTLGDLLADRAAPADVLARTEQHETYDSALWRTVAGEIGLGGLLIPEALGGAGASYRELAAAAERIGAAVAPIPYLGSAAIATAVLLSAARSATEASATEASATEASATEASATDGNTTTGQANGQARGGAGADGDSWGLGSAASGPAAAVRAAQLRARSASGTGAGTRTAQAPVSPAAALLRRLADGTVTAALAIEATARAGGSFPRTVRVAGRGDAASGTVRLRGQVGAVFDALPADILLVPADGVPSALYLVEATAPGVHRTPLRSLDMTRQLAEITLDDAPARQVAVGQAADAAVSAGLRAGAAILAAEQLGLAQRCLDLTVGYVKERRQFNRQIGSFQAVKHRLADLWTEITLARAASRYAAACLSAGDPDAPVAVALAKSACCTAAVTAAQECVQLHGGIGFTWEHEAHLYLKRAKAASVILGTPGEHRADLAALADLPAPRP
jgi:alkylation response protein AidB-like acyl-CoA dehydrogenase